MEESSSSEYDDNEEIYLTEKDLTAT